MFRGGWRYNRRPGSMTDLRFFALAKRNGQTPAPVSRFWNIFSADKNSS